MGLDVCAYKNAKQVDAENLSEEDREDFHHVFGGDFPAQLSNLVDDAYYDAEPTDAHYRRSYGGHSAFREVLAKLAGYEPIIIDKPDYTDPDFEYKLYLYNFPHVAQVWTQKKGPFLELICFSDCEGYIGTEICKKLADDFADYADKAQELPDHDKRSYFQMKDVFKVASENGFAKFS